MNYPPPAPFSPWRYHGFLCHSSLDKDIVRDLYDALTARGFKIWFDETAILPGQSIPVEVENGILASYKIIALFSSAFFGSDWTTLETLITLHGNVMNRGPRLIPVRLAPCTIRPSLAHLKYIDAAAGLSPQVIDFIGKSLLNP